MCYLSQRFCFIVEYTIYNTTTSAAQMSFKYSAVYEISYEHCCSSTAGPSVSASSAPVRKAQLYYYIVVFWEQERQCILT